MVYITHRLAEVRELAHRVTVLRDGKMRGTAASSEITDEELLAMIVGRQLESTFPPKHGHGRGRAAAARGECGIRSRVLGRLPDRTPRRDHRRGRCRRERPGELLRALAGLARFTGDVHIGDRRYSAQPAPQRRRRTCRPTVITRA